MFPVIHVISPLPDRILCCIADSLKAIRCLVGETELVNSCIALLKKEIASLTTDNVILSSLLLFFV